MMIFGREKKSMFMVMVRFCINDDEFCIKNDVFALKMILFSLNLISFAEHRLCE